MAPSNPPASQFSLSPSQGAGQPPDHRLGRESLGWEVEVTAAAWQKECDRVWCWTPTRLIPARMKTTFPCGPRAGKLKTPWPVMLSQVWRSKALSSSEARSRAGCGQECGNSTSSDPQEHSPGSRPGIQHPCQRLSGSRCGWWYPQVREPRKQYLQKSWQRPRLCIAQCLLLSFILPLGVVFLHLHGSKEEKSKWQKGTNPAQGRRQLLKLPSCLKS